MEFTGLRCNLTVSLPLLNVSEHWTFNHKHCQFLQRQQDNCVTYSENSERSWISAQFVRQPLNHSLEQHIYLILPTTKVSAIDKVVVLLAPAAIGCVELEIPEEVSCLLEVRTDREYLMDQVFHADDAKLAYTTTNNNLKKTVLRRHRSLFPWPSDRHVFIQCQTMDWGLVQPVVCLISPQTHCVYPHYKRDGQAELICVADYMQRSEGG